MNEWMNNDVGRLASLTERPAIRARLTVTARLDGWTQSEQKPRSPTVHSWTGPYHTAAACSRASHSRRRIAGQIQPTWWTAPDVSALCRRLSRLIAVCIETSSSAWCLVQTTALCRADVRLCRGHALDVFNKNFYGDFLYTAKPWCRPNGNVQGFRLTFIWYRCS